MNTFIQTLNNWIIRAVLILAGLFATQQAAQASDEPKKNFECVPEKRLQSELKTIRLPSLLNPEGNPAGYVGGFVADRLEFVRKGGGSWFIELEGPLFFNPRSKVKHTACENFAFRFMDDLVFFNYMHGTGNPYPAQQILVFDQKLKLLKLSPAMYKIFNQSLNVDFRGDCIEVVGELRGDFELGCIRNGTYVVEKKTICFVHTNSKEYRVLCDTKSAPGLVLELSEQLGTAGPKTRLVPLAVPKKAEVICRDLQKKVKPEPI
jgi:hypothetical protein